MITSTPFDLAGRVAVVTGASSGLGDRFARVLHAAGAHIVVAARRRERIDALADELDGALAVPCDVTDERDLAGLVDRAVDRFGRIDVLVNNAGVGAGGAAEHESLDRFRTTLDVNVTGLFALCQLAGRTMLEQGSGSIVNVASIFGLVASAPLQQAGYCASKAAVVNLTRQLALEWARRGVRVNALAPGWFPTEMTEDLFADGSSTAWLERNTPMGRTGAPHELDGALLLLASDAGSFITGQVLTVDGGWTAR